MTPERWQKAYIVIGAVLLVAGIVTRVLLGWRPDLLAPLGFILVIGGAAMQQRSRRAKAVTDPPSSPRDAA